MIASAVVIPHRECGGCSIFLCHLPPAPSFLPRLLCFLSSASPVLWLSTDAVQLNVPIGDDGQLMSFSLLAPARPMAQYKCSSIFSSPAARSFRSSFAFLFRVRKSFRSFSFRQTSPFLRSPDFSVLSLFRLLRSSVVPL